MPDRPADHDARLRLEQTEVNRRRLNEALDRHAAGSRVTCLCECGRLGCVARLELTREEYGRARSGFDTFIVAPGHAPGDARLVTATDRYAVASRTLLRDAS